MTSPDDLVTVGRFPVPTLAELARLRLGDAGIDAVVTGGHFGSLRPDFALSIPLIELQVRRADAERAAELLEEGSGEG